MSESQAGEVDAQALERVKALIDAWSDPEWSGHDTAAPFVRALRKALSRVTPPT